MKKKLILVILGLVLLIPTSASAKETDKFVNRFDVEISKEEYETLKKMGYSDEIINGITKSYFEYIMKNKDTLVITSIKNGKELRPYSIDDYPRDGLYQDFNTYGGRHQITSVNYATHNGNKVYEVVNFVSWLDLPRVRSVDLNMITFDDFYVTPIRDSLDGEQDISYTTCPNGHKQPDEIVYYNPYGNRVIYGAEAVGFGMNIVNDYEGQGKCVDGIASMIKVKLDNTRSDVNNFYVNGTYLHSNIILSSGDILKALAKGAITHSVRKGVIEIAKELFDLEYDKGNITGITVEYASW